VRWLIALTLAASSAACSEPGRLPAFDDAAPRFEAGQRDAEPAPDAIADAGAPDSEVVLFDSGEPPLNFAFTGVWQIDNDQNRLFAREVMGKVAIIIGGTPYVYTGTIEANGDVTTTSPRLLRSGCPDAHITGSFQRMSSAIFLSHVTCGGAGPFTAAINGGFETNFRPGISGIYRVAGLVMGDSVPPCYAGAPGPFEMFWGINVGPSDNTIVLFTAHDVVAESAVYVGRLDNDGRFDATESLFAEVGRSDVAMRGTFTAAGLDPAHINGSRDVYDAQRRCTFTIGFDGTKVAD